MAHWLAIVDVHEDAATRARAWERLDAIVVPMLEEMATSKGEGAFVKPAMAAEQMIATLAARRATL